MLECKQLKMLADLNVTVGKPRTSMRNAVSKAAKTTWCQTGDIKEAEVSLHCFRHVLEILGRVVPECILNTCFVLDSWCGWLKVC